MKVIFLEDVTNVAEVGQVKEVADGYGRNFLLPRKLAVLANSGASSIVKAKLKKKAIRQAQMVAEMAQLAKKLDGKKITLKAKVGEKERLYGSITNADIAGELSSSAGLEIDKRKVELDEPIRQLGDYEVTIRLTKDITPKIKLKVVAEEEEKEETEEPGEKKEKTKTAKKTRKKSVKKEAATAEIKEPGPEKAGAEGAEAAAETEAVTEAT